MIRSLILLSVSLLTVTSAYALDKKCGLAEKLYLQGDYSGAVYECERLLQEYRYQGSKFKSEAAYLAGLSYLKLGNSFKAKKYFEFVLDNSTDPLLAGEAEMGLAHISEVAASIEESPFFSVQLGSFKDERNANRLYNKFKRRNYSVRIEEEKDKRGVIYKVKLGRFKSKEEAIELARRLNKMGYQAAVINERR